MIKKFSEEASINNLGSVQYDRPQKYMTQKDKDQAWENLGLDSEITHKLEEILFANLPIESSTLRFSFGDMDYDPTKDTTVASKHNTSDRAGGGTTAGYGGTWKKLNAYYSNIWDYTYVDNTLLNEFDNGNFSYEATPATRFWNDVEHNPIKVIASNTTGCTSFKRVFNGVWALTEVWYLDTSDSTNCGLMFSYCKNLVKIPKLLDFSKVSGGSSSGLNGLFQYCFSLKEVDNIIWPDNTKTNSMNGVFTGCISLERIKSPVSFASTTNGGVAFAACPSLSELEVVDTGACTNMSFFFACDRNLPESTWENISTAAATNLASMFAGFYAQSSSNQRIYELETFMDNVTSVPSLDLTKATSVGRMFEKCNLLYIDSTKFENLKTSCNITNLFLDSTNVEAGMISTYNTLLGRTPSNYNDCFANCGTKTESGKIERKYIPTSWGGDKE